MNSIITGDIVFFKKYFFTDTGESLEHFALVLLSPKISQRITSFESQFFCSVITSNKPKIKLYISLSSSEYKCFHKESFICFDRRDLQSVNDLHANFQKGHLLLEHKKEGFKTLKKVLFSEKDSDKFFRAVLIREWKNSIKS